MIICKCKSIQENTRNTLMKPNLDPKATLTHIPKHEHQAHTHSKPQTNTTQTYTDKHSTDEKAHQPCSAKAHTDMAHPFPQHRQVRRSLPPMFGPQGGLTEREKSWKAIEYAASQKCRAINFRNNRIIACQNALQQ